MQDVVAHEIHTPIVHRQADGTKIHEIAGHKFKAAQLHQPTFCSLCTKMIYGLGKQGYKCLGCETVVHKRCHGFVTCRCTFGPPAAPRAPDVAHDDVEGVRRRRSASEEPRARSPTHHFSPHFYRRPTVCDHCGSLLYGLTKQGVQCSDCHANVHYRCQDKAMHNCGIQVQ